MVQFQALSEWHLMAWIFITMLYSIPHRYVNEEWDISSAIVAFLTLFFISNINSQYQVVSILSQIGVFAFLLAGVASFREAVKKYKNR